MAFDGPMFSMFSCEGPMFVPLPAELVTGGCGNYGSSSIKERLEPRSIPFPERLLNPQEALWSLLPSRSSPGFPVPPTSGFAHPAASEASQCSHVQREHALVAEQPCGRGALQKKSQNVQVVCEPVHKDLGMEVAKLSLKTPGKSNRWWTLSRLPLTCPLTGFPIKLLPYPPFKLGNHPEAQHPRALVDGKFLALHLMAFGSLVVEGHHLQPSDVTLLDKHIQRCKLGPFRPARAFALARDTRDPELSATEQQRAAQELNRLRCFARAELGKFCSIQFQRLTQQRHQLMAGKVPTSKNGKDCKPSQQQVGSEGSTCSGCGAESDNSRE